MIYAVLDIFLYMYYDFFPEKNIALRNYEFEIYCQ